MANKITHKDNITGNVLSNKITHEDNINNYEEFDYITDFYLPIKEVEDKYSSPILKKLRAAKVDAYEHLGLEKVEGVGEIKKIEDKAELAEAKKTVGQHLLDFAKDLPEGFVTELGEAGANVLNNFVQLFGFGSNMIFKGTKFDEVSQTTTEFAQGYNKGTEEFIAKLNKYKEENDVNGASELVGELGIDIGAYYPINKMLKKAGIPDKVSTPLAFGLAWGFTGGDAETEKGMFIDSEVIHGVNDILGVLEDTPESEVAELVGNTFEGTIWGGIGDQLYRVFKIIKNNVPAFINQQTATSVGGSAIAGSAAMELQEQTPDLNVENENLDEEKKTLNFEDRIKESSPMPGDDEMASAGSIFGPIFKSIVRETAKKLPNKGTGEQIFNTLKNSPGVKSSELKWTGLDDFLKGKKSVTKQEVQDFLKNNSVDVTEVKFGGPQRELLQDTVKRKNAFEKKWLNDKKRDDSLKEIIESPGFDTESYIRNGIKYDAVEVFDPADQTYTSFPFDMFKMLYDDTFNAAKKTVTNPEGTVFKIPKLELEKFKIEDEIRNFRKSGGQPKFEQQTEPGGTDYTELVFKIKKGGMDVGIPSEIARVTPANEQVLKRGTAPYKNPAHMNIKSEIAHVRFKTRDLNDMKVLTVEEMQSDFATAVRKSNTSLSGSYPDKFKDITDFPFKNTWYEMTVKRLIRYAADNGFDAVAIPKGSVIQDRYQLTRRIDDFNISYFDEARGEVGLFARDQNGVTQIDEIYTFDRIKDEFGEDVLNRVLKKGPNINEEVAGIDEAYPKVKLDKIIEMGGEGKTQLYNVAIPKFMKKYGKKWNAKVYDDLIETRKDFGQVPTPEKMPVTIIKLTPEMKKSVQQDSQALFNIFGLAGVGGAVVSDSIKNNNISQTTN